MRVLGVNSPSAYPWQRQGIQKANGDSSSSSSSFSSALTSATASSSQTPQSVAYASRVPSSVGFLASLTNIQSGNLTGALTTVESALGVTK